jgi:hypothetical protein
VHCLHRTTNRTEAQLLRGVLEAEGVATYVQGEHLFGLQGEIPVGAAFELRVCLVDDEQRPKAETLVRNWLDARNARDEGPPWRCERCGEQHEPQFLTCWKCGAESGAPR